MPEGEATSGNGAASGSPTLARLGTQAGGGGLKIVRKGSNMTLSQAGVKLSNKSRAALMVAAQSRRILGHVKSKEDTIAEDGSGGTSTSSFAVGDRCSTLAAVTLRKEQDLESEVMIELPSGTALEILVVGEEPRIKVKANEHEGWLSSRTQNDQPLISKLGAGGETEKRNSGSAAVSSSSTAAREPRRTGASSMQIKELLEAARKGDAVAVRKIVECTDQEGKINTRPTLNCHDIRGKTPLMYACAFGHKEVVEYLLAHTDIDVNVVDGTQKCALHHASRKLHGTNAEDHARQVDVVKLLLENGAFTESRDHHGCTPIMFAASSGNSALLAILITAEANVNAKDFEGHRAIDFAANFQHHAIEQMLKDAGSTDDAAEKAAGPVRKKALQKAKSRQFTRSLAMQGLGTIEEEGEVPEMKVEEEPVEAVDEKQLAIDKLKVLMEEKSVEALEIEQAIEKARSLGASDEDVKDADKFVQDMKARARAREELRLAILERDIDLLKAAIPKAEENGTPSNEIDNAKSILKEEEGKKAARELLKEAAGTGDATALKDAIAKAEVAGINTDELQEFKNMAAGAESKEKAQAVLKTAMLEVSNIDGLKFAIKQAIDAGVAELIIKQAQHVLNIEEPKVKAREQLEAAITKGTIDALKEAIEAGETAKLTEEDLKEAKDMLKSEEDKVLMLAALAQGIEDSMSVDMTSIDSLREGKDKLNAIIKEALAKGVHEADLFEAEKRRKKLHNTVEDLKGSIRVFCRIRPLSKKEINQGDANIAKAVDLQTIAIGAKGEHEFTFDSVWTPGTQEEVFEDCRDLVQSAVDGYNVTMFAYGQTGAGKTFTMAGVPGMEGVSPRTIKEIYRVLELGKARFEYTILGSMLELYRNDLVDLLAKGDPHATKSKLNVKVDKAGTVSVEHLTESECNNEKELAALLKKGNDQRTVAATAMNSESSRSHLVTLVKIVSVNKETKVQLRGKLLICDLAGSERLKKSQVTADMQKEAIEINKSLTALGDVVEALTQNKKGAIIPYRNHKLTQLMQDSLGGSAKTLMFINCSPANSNEEETVTALKYAQRAKRITIGSGKK